MCWRVCHPGEVLRGDIWAGMEDEVERSLSPVDLKLRGKGWSCHLGCHKCTESKASAVGRRAGRQKAHQIVETPLKSQNQVAPEAGPPFRLSSPYIPFVFVLLKLVRVLFYWSWFDLDLLPLTTQSLLTENSLTEGECRSGPSITPGSGRSSNRRLRAFSLGDILAPLPSLSSPSFLPPLSLRVLVSWKHRDKALFPPFVKVSRLKPRLRAQQAAPQDSPALPRA